MIKNTPHHFGSVSILFHWVMALLIIGLLTIGLYMASLPDSTWKFQLYGWHKELGLTILILSGLRLGWRLANTVPSLKALPVWERASARLVHWVFYILIIAMPFTGWLMSSAGGYPISFFGWFTVPALIEKNTAMSLWFSEIHGWLAYTLIFILCVHIMASVKHHLWDRDNILRRMLRSS